MTKTEIAAMLAYVSELDQYMQPNEITIKAWADVLTNDMDSRWAKQHIVKHYGKGENGKLTAGTLNDAWNWSRQRLSTNGCDVCDMDDHYSQGPVIPPNQAYIDARDKLGHKISDLLADIEQANAKATA